MSGFLCHATNDREGLGVKHLGFITQTAPGKAAAWQDVICYSAHAIAGVVTAKGGTSPVANYLDEKCDLPDPNGNQ